MGYTGFVTGCVQYEIVGRPVTKKNSMRMVKNPRTGKMFPIPSKQYKEYEKAASKQLHPRPLQPISVPCNVRVVYHFPLTKKGEFPRNLPDLTNLLEATDDILVAHKIVADDNVLVVARHDGSHVRFDSEEAYTMIEISPLEGEFKEEEFENG